jgi:formate hydrogenlyase subunit 6/NADH:ubiquinone oxidoreductase subunit I
MKIGTMLKDVSLAFIHRPVTERYPYTRQATPERLRGRLQWDPEKCIGCELCAMDCPSGAIDLMVLDKKAKRFVFCYHLDKCTFCAQCVQSCRHGCLEMSADDWELASLSKEAFTLYYGEDKDVREALAGTASPDGSGPSSD